MKKQKNKNKPSGVMLYAKSSGVTSFSSLWSIKNAINTEKVGHTGTLDSFADGLLVVLSGNLTHLVPHITSFTKTYQAIVCFGKETDTLDPTGDIIKTGRAVSREQIESSLKKFTGAILQVPPLYSAVHVDGKRASDIVRSGKDVQLESRQVFIYENRLLDFKPSSLEDECSYALLEIVCSKGTYIRALARDIANSIGTVAHLSALRRTKVGPFELKDSACFNDLNEFNIENGIKNEIHFQQEKEKVHLTFEKKQKDSLEKINDIRNHFMLFTPKLASLCGFDCDLLKKEFEKSYLNGRPLSQKMFQIICKGQDKNDIAVFYPNENFAGMISKNKDSKLTYGFVVPPEKKEFKVFSWEDFCSSNFPIEWKAKGCALTVGSFEAVHAGHIEIIKSIVEQKNLIPGIVTFASSIKNDDENLFSLEQRLKLFDELGVAFAVVINFTQKFAKIEGKDFIAALVNYAGMKFLAEGNDFKCGYKGSCNMENISELSNEYNFALCKNDYVLFEDEKISSSRVKKEIVNANFINVQKMLLRPYSLDVQNISWKEKTSGKDFSLFEGKIDNQKILLPKNGFYNVVVVTKDNDILHTSLSIENSVLKISLPTKNIAEKIIELRF